MRVLKPSLSFNLWSRDEENFCATVPKDGRSYSPMLFAQTVRVLKKINKPGNMIVSFSNLAERIKVRTRVNLSSGRGRRWNWFLASFSICVSLRLCHGAEFLGVGLHRRLRWGSWESSLPAWTCKCFSYGLGANLLLKEVGDRVSKSCACPPVSCRPPAAGGRDVCGRL